MRAMGDHVLEALARGVQDPGRLAVAHTQSVPCFVQNIVILRGDLAVRQNLANQIFEFLASVLQGLRESGSQKARR